MSNHRPGGVIPNASDSGISFRQAEPDAGDFVVLGSGNFGVLDGYDLTVSPGSVSIGSATNRAVVNGNIVTTAQGSSLSIRSSGSSDRLDLVGVDASGNLVLLEGTASDDAKFAPVPAGVTVLWAIFVPANSGTLTNDSAVDKRRWFQQGAKGSVSASSIYSKNVLADGTAFTIKGDGSIEWPSGMKLNATSSPAKVSFSDGVLEIQNLNVTGTGSIGGNLTVGGTVTSSNIKRGSVNPNAGNVPGTLGDLYSSTTTGQLFTYMAATGDWAEIHADEYPPGTIISSLLVGPDASTYLPGWLALDGGVYPASDPRLGRIPSIQSFSGWYNAVTDSYHLPDLSGRYLKGVTPGSVGGSGSTVLTADNLPAHKHFSSANTLSAGGHTHSSAATTSGAHAHDISAGSHTHTVNDPGHAHNANHGYNTPTAFIASVWGGGSKIDGPMNDGSHTYSVDALMWTTLDKTGVTINNSGAHGHGVASAGTHTHTITIGNDPGHTHQLPTESTVGISKPVDIDPPFFGVSYYLKV